MREIHAAPPLDPRELRQGTESARSKPWSRRWSVRLELRFIAVTLLLAGLADASEFIPRLW